MTEKTSKFVKGGGSYSGIFSEMTHIVIVKKSAEINVPGSEKLDNAIKFGKHRLTLEWIRGSAALGMQFPRDAQATSLALRPGKETNPATQSTSNKQNEAPSALNACDLSGINGHETAREKERGEATGKLVDCHQPRPVHT